MGLRAPCLAAFLAFAAAPGGEAGAATPARTAADTLVFRETLVGMLPMGIQQTWTFIREGDGVHLTVETRNAKATFRRLDRTTHFEDRWLPPHRRVEYAGKITGTATKLSIALARTGGDEAAPATLSLRCADRMLAVHLAFAELVEGWKHDDDTMEPASWAPARTVRVRGLVCTGVEDGDLALPFTEALSFVRPGHLGKEAWDGVEWGFTNGDMVIQEGGLRFIPAMAAPGAPPPATARPPASDDCAGDRLASGKCTCAHTRCFDICCPEGWICAHPSSPEGASKCMRPPKR